MIVARRKRQQKNEQQATWRGINDNVARRKTENSSIGHL